MQRIAGMVGFRRVTCMVLTLLFLYPLWNPVRGDEAGSASVETLKAQLATVNRELDDAQRQLSAMPGPNFCCCAEHVPRLVEIPSGSHITLDNSFCCVNLFR